jgi:hypothetical protein
LCQDRNNRILKTKLMVSKLVGLNLFGVCVLHCSELDWVREYVAGHVMWKPACTEDIGHWPVVLRSICYVGERLQCREPTNNSFLFPYYMISVIPVFPLQCLLFSVSNAYAEFGLLVLMYRVCSLCCFVIVSLIVLRMNYCKCYFWVCISLWDLCWS